MNTLNRTGLDRSKRIVFDEVVEKYDRIGHTLQTNTLSCLIPFLTIEVCLLN
ncbi:MAG TPA: hypothetical protein GX505_02165 [Clostridiales bacterium]|nr:hypothetical protein [Clostridiales bacterium]